MVGHSFTTLFVNLAERSTAVSNYMVLAVSTTIVSIFAIDIVVARGELKPLIFDLERGTLAWAIAGGIALTVAVSSLFHALSLGPAIVVVPIYGMFIIGGSLLGVLFLGEPMTWNKIVGLAAAVLGVVLISIRERGRPETLSEFSPLICHCQSCIVTTDAEESRALETGSGGGASHLISKRYIARRTQPEVARSLLFISRTCRCRYPNLDRCALQSRPTRVILASLVIQPKDGDVDEQDRLPDRGA
jgi:bacterial/archaeal transporter family protein